MSEILDLLEIDGQFESSVNLLIDKGSLKKIKSYIPLASQTAVLNRYLKNVLNNSSEKSTMLIGPYGKGKSHLILVLCAILEKLHIEDTCATIGQTDKETGELIDKWYAKNGKMLTVILSNTGESLNQTFLMGLYEALKAAELENIMPDTYFKEAIKAIENWRDNFSDTYKAFLGELEKRNIDTDFFVRRLEQFDERYLEIFKAIYPRLTSGSVFNPMINMSVISLYSEINRVLCESFGYAGMFVVFDEFSKYIEGNTKENVSTNMKIVQDFCELANHSLEYPIHISFIAHKSIREYRDVLPDKVIQGFRGIEGRIKEILFISSEKNNYSLISKAIKKKETVLEKASIKNYIEYQSHSRSLPCFCGVFGEKDFEEDIIKGCYPINPVSAYILLRISEKIGQNERTLFTYIAKNEQGSMVRELKGRVIGEEVNGGDIYDYFENLFKGDGALPLVHNEWLKADYALSKAENEEQRRIIKSLALILMVNRGEELPAGNAVLKYASGLSDKEYDLGIKALIDNQLIAYRERTKSYSFKNDVGIDLFKEVKNTANESFMKIELIKELKSIIELRYMFPRKYNVDYTMTRYFEYAFLNSRSFFEVSSAGLLFEKSFSDGRIIVIMDGCSLEDEEVGRKLRDWNDPRIIAIRPFESFDKEQSVKHLLAVRKLLEDESFTENNKALIRELKIYEEDLLYEINTAIAMMASPMMGKCSLVTADGVYKENVDNRVFNKILSDVCKTSYVNSPRINNEQINRRRLSNQINKARAGIIRSILEQESFEQYDKGKSPEAAIFRAVFYGTGILGRIAESDRGTGVVLTAIREFIKDCSGRKQCFADLYEKLEGVGIGVRRGVIPIFIAYCFAELTDMPFIYFNNREVVLDEKCLSRINEAPENYYLFVEPGSAEKETYLEGLEDIFIPEGRSCDKSGKGRAERITAAAIRWYRGLAHYAKTLSEKEWHRYLTDSQEVTFVEFNGFRRVFKSQELNPREVLFEKLPAVFMCDEACDNVGILRIARTKQYMEQFIDKVKERLVCDTRNIFGSESGNLCAVLKDWYNGLSERKINSIYTSKHQELLRLISNVSGSDEFDITERLAKTATGIYIEDWGEDSLNVYLDTMKQFYSELSEEDVQSDAYENALIMRDSGSDKVCYYSPVDESGASVFLKNAIEDVMNEFGDGIDENEKISVLVDILKSITGR